MEASSSPPVPAAPPATPPTADVVLAPFFEAEGPEAAREALGALLERQATPVLRAVVGRQLGRPGPVQDGQDVEDVVAGALLRLAEHLWNTRAGAGPPIASFAAYVVATAQNACHAFLRRRQPERARLRSRLRYLLTHDLQLALWQEGAAEPLCGLAAWRDRAASADAERRLAEMRGRVAAPSSAGGPLAFARLVRELLSRAGGPCRLTELATLLEDIVGVASGPLASSEELSDESGEITVASSDAAPDDLVEQRDALETLWREVLLLPRHQRVALLLNLRDEEGRGMIGLLPLIGLATQDEIAAALDMPPSRLAAIWDELPRDDEWIARELKVTRRQVINFRKCARERLWRRTRQARG